jgi:hypothetical protein
MTDERELRKIQDVAWHRHKNGGGWVSETASVEETVRIYGNAEVSGDARVYGHARVYGDAWNESPPQAVIGRWYACWPTRSLCRIGCEEYSPKEFLKKLDKLAEQHAATELERKLAEAFIRTTMEIVK